MRMNCLLILLISTAILSGCSHASVSTCFDVLREVSPGDQIPQGFSELSIFSSLKTYIQGKYLLDEFLENKKRTSDYTLLINIDGQVTNIKGTLKEENINTTFPHDSEARKEIRYVFSSKFRLRAGKHHLVIMMPEDCINIEKEMILVGGANTIQLVPIYKIESVQRNKPTLISSCFSKPLKGFDVLLNGKSLQE